MNFESLGECVTEGEPSNCKGCDSAFFGCLKIVKTWIHKNNHLQQQYVFP